MKWHDQQLKGCVLDVLDEVRESVREGDFQLRSWDHNSPHYRTGRSNKRLKIAGAILLEGKIDDPTFQEAKDAVLETILGKSREN